jgi:hypothetical protein
LKTAFVGFVAGLAVSACSGEDAKHEQEAELARYQERQARSQAERKAEQDLMSNPAAAIEELERQLERHLSGSDGMLMLWADQNTLVVYLRPSLLAGAIRCGRAEA